MEENPEDSGNRPIKTVTRCSAYGDKPEVLEHIYDANINYTNAHFSIALEDYLKLKAKREEYKQCEICTKKVENENDLYITADKRVKCIKCTNPSYANLFENDSKNHKENDQSVDKTYFLIKAKQKQCETCNITVENENELKIHRKSVHGPIPDESRSPGKNMEKIGGSSRWKRLEISYTVRYTCCFSASFTQSCNSGG